MAQRTHYWSSSRFASWVLVKFQATPKPASATAEGWVEWRQGVQKAHPAVYWFTEEFLNEAQNFVCWPYDKMRDTHDWLFNRYVSKSHIIRTGLKPGEYHGVEERILNGLFTELVDFIEIEKAWHHCACDSKARKKYNMPWGWRQFRMSEWRCPEAGLSHLEWESQLKFDEDMGMDKNNPEYGKFTHQAEGAQEQRRLYNWWKTERPARRDPYEESGWSAWCDRKRGDEDDVMSSFFGEKTDEERAESKRILDVLHELEKKQDDEDESMMASLIRIRKSLWT